VARTKTKPVERCVWKEEDDGSYWGGTCGIAWVLTCGTPREHQMNYCPRCGKPLKQVGR
jgi:hypothetical protein